ncbi:GH23566 [Drosophila grimshawi]|uniref:GH23566 n=1 Tax=Drosophila grimshawi TaxID=7222 RepID=B4K0B8_DROGR|nr:GH23566 [Drosophila grimshawi]
MPLSQGYCMKPSLDAKRALKALRKENQREQQLHHHHQHHHHNQSQPLSSSTHTLQALLQSNNNHNNSSSHSNNNSSLQLSFLLGESYARSGNILQAFAVYEHIASRQQDGHVPLDKLAALASALTTHLRQLGGSGSRLAAVAGHVLESSLKSRYQRQRQHVDNWPAHTLGLDLLPDVADADLFLSLSDDQPRRELRVPSPAQNVDYDPLLCPLCGDMLRVPVTTNCGHTFCGQCCETITQCNICHTKFPRCVDRMPQGVALTSTSSTSTTAISLSSTGSQLSATRLWRLPPVTVSSFPRGLDMRLPVVAAPTTVTTTTVASTTATATTTMAATSSSSSSSSLVVGLGGYALGGGARAMKFMPDVLVRRLVEKWWGAELQAKAILERATSYMHLNHLDDALKFCNASLEKGEFELKQSLLDNIFK